MSDVGDLLLASRSAHLLVKQAQPRNVDGSPFAGNPAEMHRQLAIALDTREQANAADPTHADPEWAHDVAEHLDLVEFYSRALESWPV